MNNIKYVIKYTKNHPWLLVSSIVLAIISVGSMLYIPIIIGQSVDLLADVSKIDYQNFYLKLIFIFILALIYGSSQWLLSLLSNVLSNTIVEKIRNDAFSKVLIVPMKYIDQNSKGELITLIINDTEIISSGLLQGFIQLFTGISTIIGTIVFMFFINIYLAIVVIILTPLSLFVASFITKRIHQMYQLYAKTYGQLVGVVDEYIGSQKIIKAYNYENEAFDKFQKLNKKLYKHGVKAQIFSAYINPSTRFVNGIVYTVVGIIGALLVYGNYHGESGRFISSSFTVGTLTSFLSYASQYTKPFNEISGVVNELQTASICAGRVFRLINSPNVHDSGKQEIKAEGNFNINNVYFSYHESQKLLEDFNLTVKKGQRVAIVGPTGCGKTTIINLLMRFYEINQGSIFLDEINIQNISRKNLRNQIGMVLQDTWLFKGTIKENISYGLPSASMTEIIEAAKRSHCHGFIMNLKDGYNTIVSNSQGLSEGQRQLLCIARVMLLKPPILILDEATSNIDTLTEIKVQEAFQVLMEGRTSFVIAHRLSTIKKADVILVMNQGKIIEHGNHQELLTKEGFYYHLYISQFEG